MVWNFLGKVLRKYEKCRISDMRIRMKHSANLLNGRRVLYSHDISMACLQSSDKISNKHSAHCKYQLCDHYTVWESLTLADPL